jgi:hypothetical protein
MFAKLVGLQYKIVYKKGLENGAADALSRRPHSAEQLLAISSASPKWVQEVALSYEQDDFAKTLIT